MMALRPRWGGFDIRACSHLCNSRRSPSPPEPRRATLRHNPRSRVVRRPSCQPAECRSQRSANQILPGRSSGSSGKLYMVPLREYKPIGRPAWLGGLRRRSLPPCSHFVRWRRRPSADIKINAIQLSAEFFAGRGSNPARPIEGSGRRLGNVC